MSWWLWLVLGLVLVGLEVLTPGGFYVLFFGLAALAVGCLAGVGWGGPIWLQWLLFSALSLLSLLCLRPYLLRAARSRERPDPIDSLEGQVVVLTGDLAPEGFGKAELRGTSWSVRSDDPRPLRAGQRCRVLRVDGLTLWVRGE